MSHPRLRVGCSGWNYASWRGPFYPHDLASAHWLAFYAERFSTVELNNSFYRLPSRAVFANWRASVGADFTFAVKGSRFLTHLKRLRDPREPLERLFGAATGLGRKLGPVLYQLPETLHCDLARLDTFLAALPTQRRHVIEFRHASWAADAVYARLAARRVTLCLHDRAGAPMVGPFIGPFAYVRFHGADGNYQGSYPDAAIDEWATRLTGELRRGHDVYAYFNNDAGGIAPHDAARLRAAIQVGLTTSP